MSYHAFKDEDGGEYGSFEVFHWDGEQGSAPGTDPDEYLVWDVDNERAMPGWYWWACFPGCLPDGDPNGPFETEAEAIADANNNL